MIFWVIAALLALILAVLLFGAVPMRHALAGAGIVAGGLLIALGALLLVDAARRWLLSSPPPVAELMRTREAQSVVLPLAVVVLGICGVWGTARVLRQSSRRDLATGEWQAAIAAAACLSAAAMMIYVFIFLL